MRYLVVAVCVSCAVVAVLAGWGWQRWLSTEVAPSQYGSLYALRRMAPALFMEKLLPGLEDALKDGRLTNGELRALEPLLGAMGPVFLEAVQKRSLDEQLSQSLDAAGKKSKETGKNVGDAMEQLFDNALDFMLRKSDELTTPSPKAEPPAKPEAPATF